MEIIVLLIGIGVGFALTAVGTYFLMRREKQSAAALTQEVAALRAAKETLAADNNNLRTELQVTQANLRNAQEQAEKDDRQRKATFQTELKLLQEQMRSQYEEEMKKRAAELKDTNLNEMGHVVKPLYDQIDNLRKAIDLTKETNTRNTASIAQSIRDIFEHDKERDKTTQTLANALKNRGKVQGDWGEQVLANILSDSGLREGEEYFVQDNIKDETGKNLRPDIVVKSADGTRIVIDSKVSLSAFSDYVGAETDEERKAAEKANYDSIWQHVEELSAKDYSTLVPNAAPIVLMFVPNEGSYILAMNHNPALGSKAYQKNVLIINPTNLMVVLRLIFLTWQNTRREKNYENICKAASKIYDKFVVFANSYVTLGNQLNTVRTTYERGTSQLREGNGNLSSQLQKLLRFGATSAKVIPEELQSLTGDENENPALEENNSL